MQTHTPCCNSSSTPSRTKLMTQTHVCLIWIPWGSSSETLSPCCCQWLSVWHQRIFTHKGWQDWLLRENAGRRGLCLVNEQWCCQYSIKKTPAMVTLNFWLLDFELMIDPGNLAAFCYLPCVSHQVAKYIKLRMKLRTVFANRNSNSLTLLPLFYEISTTC